MQVCQMLSIARGATRIAGREARAAIGSHAHRKWRVVAAGLTGLVCAIALAGCSLPTVEATGSSVAFEGGSCSISVHGTDAQPDTTYGIGMYTTASPVDLGTVTSNSSGLIHGLVNYASGTVPHDYPNLYVQLYGTHSGHFGLVLATAKVTIEVCLPTGLAP